MPRRFALLILFAAASLQSHADPMALTAAVYARSTSPLLWSDQGRLTAQAQELLEVLAGVASVGLRPEDYEEPQLLAIATRLQAGSPETDWAQFDHRLTRAAVQLIQELHYGRVDPRDAGFELPEPRADLDVAATVASLAGAARVAAVVASVEPQFVHYQLLKQALARYQALLADTTLTQLPAPGKRGLHSGDPYPGAAALRRLLTAEGDIPEAPPTAPGAVGAGLVASDVTLDESLVAGLRHYQDRHGLEPDGSLGAATFAALTTPIAARVRQIELTLERWRWLPPFDTPPIIVNIPQFRLFAFSTTADRVASILQMPVIVGQTYADKRTPIFVGDMKYVVFRPYWDVPRSILLRDLLPKIRANPGYLTKEHLEIVAGDSDAAPGVAPVLAPTAAHIADLAAGRLRLRQQPGADNALGLIKFIFPNVHDVYMHSTPARRLFSESRRAFSHGCIRVSDPPALAEFVLRKAAAPWSRAQIDAAMEAGDDKRVALREPIHVMILYGTALATEAGPVEFFDDLYGQDRKLEALLKLPRP
jgi:murein L,D-transpeptidase YcbB/YkuD